MIIYIYICTHNANHNNDSSNNDRWSAASQLSCRATREWSPCVRTHIYIYIYIHIHIHIYIYIYIYNIHTPVHPIFSLRLAKLYVKPTRGIMCGSCAEIRAAADCNHYNCKRNTLVSLVNVIPPFMFTHGLNNNVVTAAVVIVRRSHEMLNKSETAKANDTDATHKYTYKCHN